MKFIRNLHAFAYIQGFYERIMLGDGAGRTHATDQDWNECYDTGMNHADFLTGKGTLE